MLRRLYNFLCLQLRRLFIDPNLNVELLEQVQSRFTKRLQSLRYQSYEKRLQLLNLQKLETRRLQHDLIWCYKILFGHVNIASDKLFKLHVTTTRGLLYTNYTNIAPHPIIETAFY